jgi:hypothetical protein
MTEIVAGSGCVRRIKPARNGARTAVWHGLLIRTSLSDGMVINVSAHYSAMWRQTLQDFFKNLPGQSI